MPTTFTTRQEAVEALKALNARHWALDANRPHARDYPGDVEGYVAAVQAYDDAHRALNADAKAHGFRRLFDGSYFLNPEQANLS